MLKENNKFLTFGEKMDKESTQSDKRYIQDLTRLSGNQVGTALREPNNKALHQGTLISTAVADYIASKHPSDTIADVMTAEELAEKFRLSLEQSIMEVSDASPNLVHTKGAETINDVKTFTAGTLCAVAPTDPAHLTNKKYVDDTALSLAKTEAGKIKFDILSCYPIGSIYMSLSNVSPAVLFGGVWRALDQGRVLIGAGSQYPANSSGGETAHAMTVNEMPSHRHGGSTSSAGSHYHSGSTYSAGSHTHAGSSSTAGAHTHAGSTSTDGNHYHNGSAAAAGSHLHGQTGDDPFVGGTTWGFYDKAGKYVGYQCDNDWDNASWNTSTNGSHSHRLSIDSAGSHSHTMSLRSAGDHNHEMSLKSAGSHSHSLSISSAGSHSHSVTVSSTGGGKAMSLMQPYLSVYMWTRTA